MRYYNKSSQIAERINDQTNISINTAQIALIQQTKGNFDKALKMYNKAATMFEQLRNIRYIAKNYQSIGLLYMQQDDIKNTIFYFCKARNIFKNLANPIDYTLILYQLGQCYYTIGKYEETKEHFNEAVIMNQKLESPILDTEEIKFLLVDINRKLLS